jgi:hypothetical protein
MAKRKISNKRKSTHKRKSSKLRKTKGGGCGCANKMKMWGGYGAASYQGNPALGGTSAYAQNNEINNPNTPGILQNARNVPDILTTGGGRRRSKKMRGGFSDILLGSPTDPVQSALTSSGAHVGSSIILGKQLVSPYPWHQPAGSVTTHLA